MIEVLLATRSAGKIREIREMATGIAIRWRGLDEFPDIPDSPETGRTFLENATQKSLYYGAATGLPALADDSGLEVDALDGRPGVDSAHFAGHPRDDARNNARLVESLRHVPQERRAARFRCVMVLSEGGSVVCSAEGVIEGRIVDDPRGVNGFGYDPHFFVPSLGRTTAELSPEQKNTISHRGIALRSMLQKIAHWTGQRAAVAS